MAILLFVAGIIATLVAISFYAAAASATHQILAAIIGVSACVLFGSAGTIDAIDKVRAKLSSEKPDKAAVSTEGKPLEHA